VLSKNFPHNLTILYPYRAFHNQEFNKKVLAFLLLPIFFNIFIFFSLDSINAGWTSFLSFYLPKLGYLDVVKTSDYVIFGTVFNVPSIDLPAMIPDGVICLWTAVISLFALTLSYVLPSWLTPLKYFMRAFIFLVWTSLLYFYLEPSSFAYDISVYTRIGFLSTIALLFITPWIFALTYYMFSYAVAKKIIVTTAMLCFLCIFAPLQYLMSAYIIESLSLLFVMPLYIFFGTLMDIFIVIAFYSYGVSLEIVWPQDKNRRI